MTGGERLVVPCRLLFEGQIKNLETELNKIKKL